jgi:hypothetical protein
VAYDPDLAITSGDFYFEGDPYAVFVNGTAPSAPSSGRPLALAKFTADEKKLIPSGS